MNLKALQSVISNVHTVAQQQANVAINQSLTMRNWLIGCYIVEYEQNGSDRQKYGSKVLELIAENAIKKNIKGLSETNLKLFRRFYFLYPQLHEMSTFGVNNSLFPIRQTPSAELEIKNKSKKNILTPSIRQTPSAELMVLEKKWHSPASILIEKLSYSHFVELIRIEDGYQRLFYELQSIKENWSVQNLKRAINTDLFTRTGLSKNKEGIIKKLKKDLPLTIEETIRNPLNLEFLGLPEKNEYSELDFETAIIQHLQEFISELGKGFCFEARQKRIMIGNKHYFVDLVFYHRILKCHILFELKTDGVMHEAVGQMNYYLNYYSKHEKQKNDNAPIGIILHTNDDDAEVEFALGNINNKMFVTKYKVALPSKLVLKRFIEKDLQKFYAMLDDKIETELPKPTIRTSKKEIIKTHEKSASIKPKKLIVQTANSKLEKNIKK
jgi:predicted nuclease of restriction endonuclease-like (RecB) superfamily